MTTEDIVAVDTEDSTPSGDVQPEVDAQEQPVSDMQKRLNTVTWQKHEADRKRQESDLRAEKAEAALAAKPPDTPKGEPSLEQFDFDEGKYQSALLDFKLDQREKTRAKNRLQEEATTKEAEAKAAFNSRAEQYAAQHPEYDTAIDVAGKLPLSEAVQQAIFASERGPQVHHHLLSNPNVIEDLRGLDPIQAVMRVGVIEAGLTSPTKPSNTPAPVDVVTGGGGGTGDIRYQKNTSMEDYAKAANAILDA